MQRPPLRGVRRLLFTGSRLVGPIASRVSIAASDAVRVLVTDRAVSRSGADIDVEEGVVDVLVLCGLRRRRTRTVTPRCDGHDARLGQRGDPPSPAVLAQGLDGGDHIGLRVVVLAPIAEVERDAGTRPVRPHFCASRREATVAVPPHPSAPPARASAAHPDLFCHRTLPCRTPSVSPRRGASALPQVQAFPPRVVAGSVSCSG